MLSNLTRLQRSPTLQSFSSSLSPSVSVASSARAEERHTRDLTESEQLSWLRKHFECCLCGGSNPHLQASFDWMMITGSESAFATSSSLPPCSIVVANRTRCLVTSRVAVDGRFEEEPRVVWALASLIFAIGMERNVVFEVCSSFSAE